MVSGRDQLAFDFSAMDMIEMDSELLSDFDEERDIQSSAVDVKSPEKVYSLHFPYLPQLCSMSSQAAGP
jgi:hypothetical protein